MALALVPRMRMWRRLCPSRRALANQYRKSMREAVSTKETIAQNSNKNFGVVTTLSEKNAETAARQTVESAVAFSPSSTSARLVDNLFDSYSPHIENIM